MALQAIALLYTALTAGCLPQFRPPTTGQAKGGSRREADAPQFAGTGGQGRATARAFCTLAHRGLYTGPPAWAKGALWHEGSVTCLGLLGCSYHS